MAIVSLTPHLRHVAPVEPATYPGATVADVLDHLCAEHPAVGGYLRDEHGRLRKHIAVFVEGAQLRGAEALARRVSPETEVFIFQALSGG
jgi:hypothetical protein